MIPRDIKCLAYDEKNMKYLTGYITSMSGDADGSTTLEFYLTDVVNHIDLDPTTMKRISAYNKEEKIKELDEKIKDKKRQLKELDDIITDRDKRIEKLKDFVANLYDIDTEEDW